MAGPRQVFPANITRISFPSIGGLVYFRVGQRFEGTIPAPAAFAQVEGLPWDSFNMFNVLDGKIDPELSGPIKDKEVHVSDPVTDDMIAKFLYWAQHPFRSVSRVTASTPDAPFYIVDTANWTLVYDHHITSRITVIMGEAEALAQFRGLIGSTGYEGLDPDKMGVALINPFYNEISVNPPDAYFWGGVSAGWSYHTEIFHGSTVTVTDQVASIIINTAKLFRDTPNGTNGKKPAFIDFTITPPEANYGSHGRMQWWLQAQAFTDKVTKPEDGGPKYAEGERRNFPVADKVAPIGGIPGAYTTLFDLPAVTGGWPDFPNPPADVHEKESWTAGTKARVRITFGVGKTLPKVSIVFVNEEGGGIG